MSDPSSKVSLTVEWLEERYPALVAFFRQRLPVSMHRDVHDLTQETLIAVWRAVSGGGVRDPLGYLFQVARNKCADAHRGRARAREVPFDESEKELSGCLRAVGTEEMLVDKERLEAIRQALDTLGPQEKKVLYLRYYECLGNAEAARRIGVSPEECSRIKYRAMERLRSKLGETPKWRIPRIMRLII